MNINCTTGLVHIVSALKYSLQGLRAAYKNEVAFRQELLLGLLNLAGLFLIQAAWLAKLFLFALWGSVLAVELLNSAIEAVVDLASPERNELAKRAKDMCSAAVFCCLALFAISWIIVLMRWFYA